MYGVAILFPGHPYIESATALSNIYIYIYIYIYDGSHIIYAMIFSVIFYKAGYHYTGCGPYFKNQCYNTDSKWKTPHSARECIEKFKHTSTIFF